MLVLSRKRNQSIQVGPDVRVTVLAVHGGVVQLGFEGPTSVRIYREEVYRRIEAESRACIEVETTASQAAAGAAAH